MHLSTGDSDDYVDIIPQCLNGAVLPECEIVLWQCSHTLAGRTAGIVAAGTAAVTVVAAHTEHPQARRAVHLLKQWRAELRAHGLWVQ